MAAAELIASGSTAANSSNQVLADGASLIVGVEGADDRALAIVELLGAGATYVPVVNLTRQDPAWQVFGPATYRVRRVAGGTCSVFSA